MDRAVLRFLRGRAIRASKAESAPSYSGVQATGFRSLEPVLSEAEGGRVKRKQSQRKRHTKSASSRSGVRMKPVEASADPSPRAIAPVTPIGRRSEPPVAAARSSVVPKARTSVAPAAILDEDLETSAALEQGAPERGAAPPRALHDSGEIRIEPRARLFSQIDLHTESNFFSGYSGDLSDGGVIVVTYAPLKPGQCVDVELSLPGGRFISASGRVAFLRAPTQHGAELSPGAGIVFDDLDAPSRLAVEAFMLRREPTFVDPG